MDRVTRRQIIVFLVLFFVVLPASYAFYSHSHAYPPANSKPGTLTNAAVLRETLPQNIVDVVTRTLANYQTSGMTDSHRTYTIEGTVGVKQGTYQLTVQPSDGSAPLKVSVFVDNSSITAVTVSINGVQQPAVN